jgi:hypothetical protein
MSEIETAEKIFTSAERWLGFLELIKYKDSLADRWLAKGSENVIRRWNASEDRLWKAENWGTDIDVKWHKLKDGAPLPVGFGLWRYQFYLVFHESTKYSFEEVTKALSDPLLMDTFPSEEKGQYGAIRKGSQMEFTIGGARTADPTEYAWLSSPTPPDHGPDVFADLVIREVQNLLSGDIETAIDDLNKEILGKP